VDVALLAGLDPAKLFHGGLGSGSGGGRGQPDAARRTLEW